MLEFIKNLTDERLNTLLLNHENVILNDAIAEEEKDLIEVVTKFIQKIPIMKKEDKKIYLQHTIERLVQEYWEEYEIDLLMRTLFDYFKFNLNEATEIFKDLVLTPEFNCWN